MTTSNRRVFFLGGSRLHWNIATKNSLWGLPRHGRGWKEVRAELQHAGFSAGAEVLGIAGPLACIRAVVGSDRGVFLDDVTAPFGLDSKNDVYPVRFELTKIQELNRPWYVRPQGDFKSALQERYFTERCLYTLLPGAETDRWIDRDVVFGGSAPAKQGPQAVPSGATSEVGGPEILEERASELFALIGFRVDQLGKNRPYERMPDGIASLPGSLSDYLKRMGHEPYFILWDCKYDCGARGLTAEQERAVREYLSDFAVHAKLRLAAPSFWFLLVARTAAVATRIQGSLDRATWLDELPNYGCKGLRVVTLDWLASIASQATGGRRSGEDPDQFLAQEMQQLLRTASAK
jgi:hypothetical protein